MRQKSGPPKEAPEQVVKDIRRATRKRQSPEESERLSATGSSETANPHRSERAEGRGQHRRALPPRGHRPEPLLQLVEGVPRGGQEAAGGGYRPRLDSVAVAHGPRLLSDNGSSYVSGDLAAWLADRRMRHVRGAPHHPMTQGKIERWHQTLKNRIPLEHHFLPGDLETQVEAFVGHYNHHRYHESLGNLTPADVYFGRGQTILRPRARIKRQTIERRRLLHRSAVA